MVELFISYNGKGIGFGWSKITTDCERITEKELIQIQEKLREECHDNSITILFWKFWEVKK